MKSSGNKLMMAGAVLVVLLVVPSVAFQMVTDRNRRAALAKLKKPAVIERYMMARQGKGESESEASERAEDQPRTGTDGKQTAVSENIAAFAQAFQRAQEVLQDGRHPGVEVMLMGGWRPPDEWTEEDWAPVKEFIGEDQSLINEIRRLAEMGGPVCELDFSQGVFMDLSHHRRLREMARLLQADAVLRGHEGNYAGAIEDIIAGLKLSAAIKDEPTMHSQLARGGIIYIFWLTAQSVLPREGVPADSVRGLLDYAGRCGYRESLAGSFSGDCFMYVDSEFNVLRQGRIPGPAPEQNFTSKFAARLFGSPLGRPWLNMNEETVVETMTRLSEISSSPYYEALPQLQEIARQIDSLPYWRSLSQATLRAYPSLIAKQARIEVRLDLMRIGLSVEQCHDRTGSYPATLDAIASDLGGTVPIDPFTGGPYHYQGSGGSFLLYSVGSRLIYDAAEAEWKTRDTVWRGKREEAIYEE